jgi:membrane dipeptidase
MNRRRFLTSSVGLAVSGAVAGTPGTALGAAPRPPRPAGTNEKIQRLREVALEILKPSRKELDRGLALHQEAVVFDAYGFAPRAALDGDAFRKAIEEGASAQELNDLSEEMAMTRCLTDAAEEEEFKAAWEASGVTCIFQNAGEESQDPLRLLKRLARFTYLADSRPDLARKAVRPEDVTAARKQGARCLYLSGNGVPLSQEWVSARDELRYVRIFFQLGIRMMHLTYNRRNLLGDGCGEQTDGGVSDLGRQAIAEMNRVGILVDVAHSGWRTSLEAAKASRKPVVASHTACVGVHRHIRGKPDETIRAIADTGGYIGLCCIPSFLGGKGDISALLDHVDYAVKRFGADHVAIGTDVAYTSRHAAAQNEKIPPRRRMPPRFEALWPPDSFVQKPQAVDSLAWTNWPLFTVGLVQRGHSDEDIRKIVGGNVLRVLAAVRPG